MYSGIDKSLNGTVCVINKRNIIFMKKKYRRNLKNLNKNCEKLGFSFVFEYVEIKNFKILKKKTMEHLLIVYLIH